MGRTEIRSSVKLILLNAQNKLALMCADDDGIRSASGEYRGRFWFMVGGKIEPGETILDAAKRELFEETGIGSSDVEFGPEVWKGSVDLLMDGELTTVNQRFIVARTAVTAFDLSHLTDREKAAIEEIKWFSLEDIERCEDTIYPVLLGEYLPDIISGNYPAQAIEIDLAKQPGD
ncbi:MAG: NUDIX domain-containing protein [Puniceicoccales bacterium]|jgi:8-oxo-dGTP pyrophosphatase MutT (NUDIX family)|nr:NUDIX domain-containing protein [Puniceicoccales bacterium]